MTRRAKMACLAAILAVHLALPLLFRAGEAPPQPMFEPPPEPIVVSLQRPPVPPPVPSEKPVAQSSDGGSTATEPAAPAPPPSPVRVRAARPTTQVEPLPMTPSPTPVRDPAPVVPAMPVISGGQLAGALRAGNGGGQGGSGVGSGSGNGGGAGGSCDMVARLEAALRDDAEIGAAVAAVPNAASGAVLVWDGDWIQSPGQAGKGLATVRQAIAIEVAFAPPVCRTMAVRGLALIRLAGGPGAPKLVLGKGAWRWSDLVSTRR